MSGLDSFDINAAILRKSETDLRAFMSALAVRLEQALPGRVNVDRKRDGLFSATSHVTKIEIATDTAAYTITLDGKGVKTSRAKVVHGVTISNAIIAPADWMTDMRSTVARLSADAGDASDALGNFL